MTSRADKYRQAEDKGAFLLGMLKRGMKIGPLSEALDQPASILEDELEKLRRAGRVRCTNKTWYRADALAHYKPPEPKEPRLTEKQIKFLKKQQGFGFGEKTG